MPCRVHKESFAAGDPEADGPQNGGELGINTNAAEDMEQVWLFLTIDTGCNNLYNLVAQF